MFFRKLSFSGKFLLVLLAVPKTGIIRAQGDCSQHHLPCQWEWEVWKWGRAVIRSDEDVNDEHSEWGQWCASGSVLCTSFTSTFYPQTQAPSILGWCKSIHTYAHGITNLNLDLQKRFLSRMWNFGLGSGPMGSKTAHGAFMVTFFLISNTYWEIVYLKLHQHVANTTI
jgi:hypothetical protein